MGTAEIKVPIHPVDRDLIEWSFQIVKMENGPKDEVAADPPVALEKGFVPDQTSAAILDSPNTFWPLAAAGYLMSQAVDFFTHDTKKSDTEERKDVDPANLDTLDGSVSSDGDLI